MGVCAGHRRKERGKRNESTRNCCALSRRAGAAYQIRKKNQGHWANDGNGHHQIRSVQWAICRMTVAETGCDCADSAETWTLALISINKQTGNCMHGIHLYYTFHAAPLRTSLYGHVIVAYYCIILVGRVSCRTLPFHRIFSFKAHLSFIFFTTETSKVSLYMWFLNPPPVYQRRMQGVSARACVCG